MKKIIPKPQNWQDFESLCKKLWGEIWECPNEIKRNGRLGQPQSGVDIYAIPKNSNRYSGIQCKGKDEYSFSKLSKEEIDNEIIKAMSFEPKLEYFIFATTANKDVEIEKYIRLKDEESRINGNFRILLFCWEDIVDLIENNRDTYNYYVNQNQFQTKYDLEVLLYDKINNESFSKDLKVYPKFVRKITKYALKEKLTENSGRSLFNSNLIMNDDFLNAMKNFIEPKHEKSMSWFSFGIRFNNTGNEIIENYRIYFSFEKDKVRHLSDGSIIYQSNIYSSLFVYDKDKYIMYKPWDQAPLNQKDYRNIIVHVLTNPEVRNIEISYELIASNFNKKDKLFLLVEPEFIEQESKLIVNDISEIKEDKIEILDLIKKTNHFF